MNYKKELHKHFWNSKLLTNSRYEASKNIFIYICLIFFLNYFFVWAKFYDYFFIKTLPFVYTLFLITITFFIFFYFKSKFELKIIHTLIIILLLMIFLLIFLTPISWINIYNFVIWKNI